MLAGALVAWHARRTDRHTIDAAVLLCSVAIAWLGLALAESGIG